MKDAAGNLSIENLVGGRLYAVLGSLLVIVAAGILLKLAWDAELFNLLPDLLPRRAMEPRHEHGVGFLSPGGVPEETMRSCIRT